MKIVTSWQRGIVTSWQRGSVATGDEIRGARNNMRIVTAWQRGSVATGYEIRKMRHNKCRIFSYSLILLFSVLDNAQGVKFCQQRQGYSYYRFNSTAGLWAWGDACAPSAEDAGTNLNNLCGGKYIYAGEAAMSSHPFVANTAGSPAFTYAVGENTGSYCYCRLTKPAIGPWVLFGNIVNQFTCANLCAWSLNSTNDVNMFLAMMP